ncbi:PREDICTED: cytochrome c oxidase subunit NDUFA4 [Dufourea novaeangliae]|uniref:cytochrome c oxidase subunit NDUFA4 n=1 Tax=Dufourea novaeangliae TaxID=178035 RepID=UPI00076706BA|nr:PREDICTED: cytochrome c oxidase subunit NDUFA4 [Dufourea novaeangliae]
MGKMQGLTIASLKKNPMLLPLFLCIGVGAVGSSLYLMRLAFRDPDVTWFTKKNPEPWNEYKDKDYKFMNVHHKNMKSPAPEY